MRRARKQFPGRQKRLTAVVANALLDTGNHSGAIKGWETRRAQHPTHAPGSAGKRNLTVKEKRVIRAAHAEIDQVVRQKGSYEGQIDVPGEGSVRLTFGDPGPRGGTRGRGLEKIHRKHGADALKQIPHVLLRGQRTGWAPDLPC